MRGSHRAKYQYEINLRVGGCFINDIVLPVAMAGVDWQRFSPRRNQLYVRLFGWVWGEGVASEVVVYGEVGRESFSTAATMPHRHYSAL